MSLLNFRFPVSQGVFSLLKWHFLLSALFCIFHVDESFVTSLPPFLNTHTFYPVHNPYSHAENCSPQAGLLVTNWPLGEPGVEWVGMVPDCAVCAHAAYMIL